MAEEQIILDIVIDDSKTNQSIGSMKKEIRELQSVLTTLDPNSEEFAKAAARAGELKDNIEDANEAVNNMKGEPIESLKSNFEGLGSKIKNLDFEGATRSLNAMGGSISKINFGAIVKQIGQMGMAFVKMAGQLAMSLGPLALVVGAIALVGYTIYNNYKKMEEAEKEVQAAHEEFLAVMSDGGAVMEAHAKSIENLNETYRKTKQELDLLNGDITQVQANADNAKAEAMKTFSEIAERHASTVVDIKMKYDKLMQEETERMNLVSPGNANYEKKQREHWNRVSTYERQYREASKKEEEQYQKERLINTQNFTARLEVIYKKNNEKEVQAAVDKWTSMNKAADDYFKNLQKQYYGAYYTALVTYDDELKKYDEYLKNKTWSLAQYNEAVMMLQITQKKKLDELEKLDDPDELSPEMKLTGEAYEFWLNTQIKKQQEQEKFATETIGLENELEAWKTGQYAKDIMSFEWSNTQKLEVLKRFYEAGKIQEEHYNAAVEQTWQNRLSLWQNMNGAMANMSESFFSFLENINDRNEKKQRKIKKAAFTVNKVTSAIDTAIAGAKGVIEAAPVVPLQILVAAQTAAAIASILSKKFPEEGTSGAAAGNDVAGLSTMTAIPTQTQLYNTGGGTPTTFASLTSSNQGMINRVYVVESDITSTQANVAKVNVVSSF